MRMKDSGIDWIGMIPEHWNVKRIKDIGTLVLGKMLDNKGGSDSKLMPYLKSRNIGWLHLDLTNVDEMYFNENEIYQLRLKKGDLIFSEGGEVGKTAIWNDEINDCCIQNSVHKLTIHEGNLNRFILYFSYFAGKKGFYNSYVNAVSLKHLTYEKLRRVPIVLPPIDEQRRIVAYLDEKTAEIDQQLALLEKELNACLRLKRAVINRAVTRGLHPNIPLKDSGIDWIGMIPEHWVVKRIKDVFELRNGYTPSKNDSTFWEGGTIPWYRMDDIREKGRKLNVAKQYITPNAVNGAGLFEAGSFILATTATIGEHAMLIVDSLANQRFTNLKIRKSLISSLYNEFLFYYMFVVDDFCKTSTRQTTFAAVNMEELKNFCILIPTIDEQQSIASYLDSACAKIDAKAENIRKRIDAYKRLKRSLINEVVTGKRAV